MKNRLPRSVHYGACLDSCRLLVIQRSLRTHYARNRVPKVSATDSYNTDALARLSDARATGPRSTVEISPLHSQCQGHSVIIEVGSKPLVREGTCSNT